MPLHIVQCKLEMLACGDVQSNKITFELININSGRLKNFAIQINFMVRIIMIPKVESYNSMCLDLIL